MKNKWSYILLLSAITLANPAFAISNQSQNALNAFRRYEPEFSNALRSLQELNRKRTSIKDDDNDAKSSEIWLKAEDLMSKVEDRYDLMEDLYKSTLSRNPNDQVELQNGFTRLDDLYRQVRDFYTDTYAYNDKSSEEAKNEKEETEQDEESPYKVNPLSADDGYGKVLVASDQGKNKEKINLKGSLKFQIRDSDEEHQNANMGGTVPNDQTMGRLLLNYEINENKQLSLEERYYTRERNEKIKENHFTLSYFDKNPDNSAVTLRDKLQHVWYPNDSTKNYRTNLFEVLYAKNWRNKDRLVNLGIKTKSFPHNSRSDYNEYIIGDQESWIKRDGTIFVELKNETIKYKNVGNLDYNNFNFYAELDKSYSGNKADLKVSNTYERRIYDNESVVAFRTSYYDEFFQLDYRLPVNDRVSYNFDGSYSKRNFGSDEARGYAELNLHNSVFVRTDDRTNVVYDYTYIYNDENTRDSAHKNNIFHVGWERNINSNYKIKLDDTYHNRSSVQNEILDFEQNDFIANLSWTIKTDYKLSWITEYFTRKYDSISINLSDYRFLESGFVYSFYKRKDYDWRITQKWRNMEYRNWGGVPSGWHKHVQPVTEINYNKWLNNDLKFSVRATWEKTYYSEFHNDTQELEYNFGDLIYNKEIFASLEYYF